ncbi:MAG TPA: tannase/feruloyl esterase family alpha/beta hydrolase [Candidatus Methylomirabilis sp.]|nr:tannase/feruloyl esterase family alpha/beta hydrolase [Candidatus Methylomirabilis sp.]
MKRHRVVSECVVGNRQGAGKSIVVRKRVVVSKRIVGMGLAIGLASMAFVPRGQAAGQSCEQLAQLNLPNTKITSAETIAAGAFTPPKSITPWLIGDPNFYKQVPAFCRVTAVATPTADSDIKIEVWMPASGWNGKFRGQGNGGFAGEINYVLLGRAILAGYATAATDTGHAASGTDARWALGHPEKIVDFAYRAIHEMTEVGKATTKAFYGDAPQRAYFSNCSNGGRQALVEAQRFPDDYDGIVAGAPANYWTHLLGGALYNAQMTTRDAAAYIPMSKIPAIAKAVNAACDAEDGVTDGVLNNPRKCHFKPATLLCKEGDSDSCLTHPQVTTLEKLYDGSRDSKGHLIFPGYFPGAEDGPGGWGVWITGQEPGKSLIFAFSVGFFSNMLYGKADWDYKTANIDEAVADADKKFSSVFNATNTNLKPFESHGGKMIIYHGWDDAAISAQNSINYYESVRKTMGAAQTDSFLRLYMVPGMQHCGGGPGTDTFGQDGVTPVMDAQHNMDLALEQWVEKGTAPGSIIASKPASPAPGAAVTETRPLCAYPQEAKYKGIGDTNDAANFVCAAPGK